MSEYLDKAKRIGLQPAGRGGPVRREWGEPDPKPGKPYCSWCNRHDDDPCQLQRKARR